MGGSGGGGVWRVSACTLFSNHEPVFGNPLPHIPKWFFLFALGATGALLAWVVDELALLLYRFQLMLSDGGGLNGSPCGNPL